MVTIDNPNPYFLIFAFVILLVFIYVFMVGFSETCKKLGFSKLFLYIVEKINNNLK